MIVSFTEKTEVASAPHRVNVWLQSHPRWVVNMKRRQRERIAASDTRKRWSLAVMMVGWLALEATLPKRLIDPIRNLLVVIAVWDSVATWLWLHLGIAQEGNPYVASLIDSLGNGPGLTLRAIFSVGLVWALASFAKVFSEARFGMFVVAVVFGLLTVYHALIFGFVAVFFL